MIDKIKTITLRKNKDLTIILTCFFIVFVFCSSYYIWVKANPAATVQFPDNVKVELTNLTSALYILSGSECSNLNVSGDTLTAEIPTDITFTLGSGSPVHNVLRITPSGGTVDLVLRGIHFSGEYITQWTASSSVPTAQIAFLVQVPLANTRYIIKVNDATLDSLESNTSGEITFTYSNGFSDKVFTITQWVPGGVAPPAPLPPTPPPEGFSILINDGAAYTNTRNVELKLTAGFDTVNMAISEKADLSDALQEPYAVSKDWTLSEGNGEKTVYAKFYSSSGQPSSVVSDSIILGVRLCSGADLNFDTLVDLFDFGILVYFWSDTDPANTCADINIDGIVDLVDFGTMIYEWPELDTEDYHNYDYNLQDNY